MPFIDTRQAESRASLPGAEYRTETSWWDGYAASLGHVIDEELTISQGLHRDGWANRRREVNDLGVDLQPYTDRRGRVDYDSIAAEYDLKTDAELTSERNQMLASRRSYAMETLENAPASAQFLGAMNGYLLDPLSIATMPIAYTVKGAQGLSILSRIGQTAAKAAAIEGATELAIQSVVFDYKQEIDSPYSSRDAITAIATAATGAAVLGGATTGIAGYLKGIRESVDPATLSRGELKAYESVQRLEEALADSSPTRVSDDNAYLYEFDPVSLSKTEFEAKDISGYMGDADKPILVTKIDGKYSILDGHHRQQIAINEGRNIRAVVVPESDYIAMKDAGIHPAEMLSEMTSRIQSGKAAPIAPEMMEAEAEILRAMDSHVDEYNARTFDPLDEVVEPTARAQTMSKESEVLDRTGLSDAYDETAARYNELETRTIFEGEEALNADDLIKEFDDELAGLDNVMRCVRG